MDMRNYYGKIYAYPKHNFRLGLWYPDTPQNRALYTLPPGVQQGWTYLTALDYEKASSRLQRDGSLREENVSGFNWVHETDRQIYVYNLQNFHNGTWVRDTAENRNSALSIPGQRFVEGSQYNILAKQAPLTGDMNTVTA